MKNLYSTFSIVFLFLLLQACAPGSYVIKEPTPSPLAYQGGAKPTKLSFSDKRKNDAKTFNHGVLKAELQLNGSPLDPIDYLRKHTV